MDRMTIAAVALIVVALCLAQYFTGAGSRNICIKPRDKAKGNRQKSDRPEEEKDAGDSGQRS